MQIVFLMLMELKPLWDKKQKISKKKTKTKHSRSFQAAGQIVVAKVLPSFGQSRHTRESRESGPPRQGCAPGDLPLRNKQTCW